MSKCLWNQKGSIFMVFVMLFMMGFARADTATQKTIDLEKDWGIQPVFLRITAEGFMMELRYRVLDPEKATILSLSKDLPTMLSGKSKARFSVPYGSTVGYLKSNRKFLKKDRNYIIMFSNENRHMLPGDQVRIQIGDEISPFLTIDK